MKDYLNFMSLTKEAYLKSVSPVCEKYQLTLAEFDVLMFLANNPEYDTATDIVEKRYIVKSQVSTSIKSLEQKGYLIRNYKNNNRRTLHLTICDLANPLIQDGHIAQAQFVDALMHGFSKEQKEHMKTNISILVNNLEKYVRGDSK